MTITPSTESVYPDSDWLIGNHSDELTPWIPVMAARFGHYSVLVQIVHNTNDEALVSLR